MTHAGQEMRSSSNKEHKAAAKVLDHLESRETENGGHIIEHHYQGYEHESEPHAFGPDQGHEALAHWATHMHIKHDMPSEPNAEHETGGAIPEKQ